MNSVAYLSQSRLLFEQLREVLRDKHYSLKTEQAYLYWVRFFVRWHGRPAPANSFGVDKAFRRLAQTDRSGR